MLKSLNIPRFGASEERKMPVVSSKVIRGLKTPRENPVRIAKTPTVVVSNDVLPLRTPSRAGKWACVDGCTKTFDSVPLIVNHLRTVHELPMLTEHLIPLGLGLCAFCGNVFESFRGIIVH